MAAQLRLIVGRGDPGGQHTVLDGQFQCQRRQGAPDGVDIRGHRRPLGGHLWSLVPLGAVDIAIGPDAGDRAQVDQLDLILGGDDVLRFEIVVDHAAGMEIVHGGQHLEDVPDGQVEAEHPVLLLLPPVIEGGAVDVFHDNEATGHPGIIDEVVGLHDARVGDIGQEGALRLGRALVLDTGLRHHALEHHDTVGHIEVIGQVDPPHATMGDHPQDLILLGDDVTGLQLGWFDPGFEFRLRIDEQFALRFRCDERQLHHAVGHHAGLTGDTATLTEGGDRLPAAAGTRVGAGEGRGGRDLRIADRDVGGFLHLLRDELPLGGAELIQILQQVIEFLSREVVVIIVIGEGIELHRLRAGGDSIRVVGHALRGWGQGQLDLIEIVIVVGEGVELHRLGGR